MDDSRLTTGNSKSGIPIRDDWPSDVRIIHQLLAEGYKPHDIAVLLQIPVSAIRARRRRLRRLQATADDVDETDHGRVAIRDDPPHPRHPRSIRKMSRA
jgi:hypothetical protein